MISCGGLGPTRNNCICSIATTPFWIEEAKQGWPDPDHLRKFLVTYRVMRGKVGNYLKRERNLIDFRDRCVTSFSRLHQEEKWVHTAQGRWKTVVDETGGKVISPWSAAMKTYWCHKPRKLPMYDQFTLLGLQRWAKERGRVPHQACICVRNFLETFEYFYKVDARAKVKEASAFFGRRYPYPRRVAEKYLWLAGSDSPKDALRNFRAGLRRVPIVIGG